MTAIGHSARTSAIVENIRARHGRDGKDGETQIIVQTDDVAVNALKQELAALKVQALKPKNDEQAIPLAIGRIGEELLKVQVDLDTVRKETAGNLADLHRRIQELEARPTEIVASEPAELQDNINELGKEVAELNTMILKHIVTLQKRCDAQDARFSELPQVLAQLQKERRSG